MDYQKILEYSKIYANLSVTPAVWKYKDEIKIKELMIAKENFYKSCYEYYQENHHQYYDVFIIETRDKVGLSPLTILENTQKYMIDYLKREVDDVLKELNEFKSNRKVQFKKQSR